MDKIKNMIQYRNSISKVHELVAEDKRPTFEGIPVEFGESKQQKKLKELRKKMKGNKV